MHIIADLPSEARRTTTPAAPLLFNAFLSFAGNSSLLSLIGVRLLMNMRVAAERGLNQGTSCPQVSLGQDSRRIELDSEVTVEMDFIEPNIEADEDACA